MKKAEARAALKKLSASLSSGYVKEESRKITDVLIQSGETEGKNVVFVYMSAGTEVCTEELIDFLLAEGKTVCVPVCLPGGKMNAVRINGDTAFKKNRFGISEPVNGEIIPPAEIELCIIPCVGAVKSGERLGHGMGYYDRFLSETDCRIICLCLRDFLLESLETGENDVNADVVFYGG